MNYHTLALAAMLAGFSAHTMAQKPMQAPEGGKPISDELIGIFFEDISSSADGGLCAELLQNGAFEFSPVERDGWGPATAWTMQRPGHSLGCLQTRFSEDDSDAKNGCLHPNTPNYMRLTIERVGRYYDYDGWTGFGLQNNGFDGIPLQADARYDFSVFLRNVQGEAKQARVVLVAPGREQRILAEDTICTQGEGWAQYKTTLTATEDCPNASLRILFLTLGQVDVDAVSLMPQDTYRGHGLRRDLAQALADLHPRFLRFPGGCIVHGGGDGFWNTYRWKTTIGERHTRRGQKNCWGYHQSFGLGYYEYFQLCEDLGMQPLPILPCGVSCQGAGGGWGMRDQAQDTAPMEEMDEWLQDALDLIEWANGDTTTTWGRRRAEQGHPEPFHLHYLGLGNEERITPEFAERFRYLYERVRKAHPEIVIVGTAGPGSHPGNPDYDNGWRLAEETDLPILDEHYYEPNHYFLTSRQYDKYPRDRKTKVYLGEYASKDKRLLDALAEALYLLHVERNGDVVAMTSYAPLFARRGATNWNPDLIYFDNQRLYLTCSYYVQQMFGLSSGQYYYGDCVTLTEPDLLDIPGRQTLIGQSVVLNTQKRELYIKLANASDHATQAKLDLSRFRGMKSTAQRLTLSGQPQDQNDYEAQPIAPVQDQLRVSRQMTVDVPPYSMQLITVKL